MTRDAGPDWRVLAGRFPADPPGVLGVAVSGGSDSTALLILLNDWRMAGGPALRGVTVDHGLRPEAAQEAGDVARLCARLGVPHDTLRWAGWDGRGNLPDRARRARYRLMADWARAQGICDVAVGHTRDDQAETFLMRLARGSGLDGLAAMRAHWQADGVMFHRPLLECGRDALRGMLGVRGLSWAEDPGNADPAYDRVQARRALAALAPLGLTAGSLAATARKLADARHALYGYAHAAARDNVRVDQGDLVIARSAFDALPDEVARRLLQEGLRWIAGMDYAPRGPAMTAFLAAARAGRPMALQGCLLRAGAGQLRITREYRAVAGLRVPAGALWDGRWRVQGPDVAGAEIAALGQSGLRACPDWRAGGLPHASAMACPGVWHKGELLAAPLMGWPNGWTISLVRDRQDLLASLLAH